MNEPSSRLSRTLGLPGATIFGLAAMLGTGVFVVWGPASLLAGGALLGAVVVAGLVASANAWSTVQLAVLHPESGGAYAYGRIRIHRLAGIVAGVAFIVGKTASAAAAALAIGLYLFPDQARFAALGAVLLALVLDMRGIRRSVQVSAVLVTFVIIILLTVSVTSLRSESVRDISLTTPGAGEFLAASALCFFAFAGYARITVLGEEVQDPVRTIPRAVMTSLLIVACVYLLVATTVTVALSNGVTLSAAGLLDLVEQNPPLAVATRIGLVVAAGAALLALLAGISRMVFAMAAAGDAPAGLARVTGGLPRRAQVVAALGTAVIVLAGQLSWAIALSAGSVLLYYSVAHVAAMRINRSPVIPVLGLIGCVGLVASLVVWGPVGL
jgi:APA family basic amino acid/polyamine antiporter